jgi:hypothetical protein
VAHAPSWASSSTHIALGILRNLSREFYLVLHTEAHVIRNAAPTLSSGGALCTAPATALALRGLAWFRTWPPELHRCR